MYAWNHEEVIGQLIDNIVEAFKFIYLLTMTFVPFDTKSYEYEFFISSS